MPYLKLTTNAESFKSKNAALLNDLSLLLAKETGKPERYVMVDLGFNPDMLFGASGAALAYVECKSIGLTGQQAKALSAAINRLLVTELEIAADRIYIEFSHCPAEFWGWNGSTFG